MGTMNPNLPDAWRKTFSLDELCENIVEQQSMNSDKDDEAESNESPKRQDSQQLELDFTGNDMHSLMMVKARELFRLCDNEEKGFITKRDMQRLRDELPLTPDQLEDVFDSLDVDSNGYLTLEEFTEGFGSFLGIAPSEQGSEKGRQQSLEQVEENKDEWRESFDTVLDNLNAKGVFEDEEFLGTIWGNLQFQGNQELCNTFESFIARMSGEFRKNKSELCSLEAMLHNKSYEHDDTMSKIYEEMENQIKVEREKIREEERQRERKAREEVERELRLKERTIAEMIERQTTLERKIAEIHSTEHEARSENVKLAKLKQMLEEELNRAQDELDESKTYIDKLQRKNRDDKRDRVHNAFKVSEGIAMERESLVRQLDMLRDLNKKLRDERDEWETKDSDAFKGQLNLQDDLVQVS